jgi:hypothetical protein
MDDKKLGAVILSALCLILLAFIIGYDAGWIRIVWASSMFAWSLTNYCRQFTPLSSKEWMKPLDNAVRYAFAAGCVVLFIIGLRAKL